MVCPQCQQAVDPGAQYCGNCGFKLTFTALTSPFSPPAQQPQESSPLPQTPNTIPSLAGQDHSGKAIASFVLGVLGLPASLIPIVGVVFGILAIILGSLSIHSRRKALAIIGISLAVITLLASIFLWVMATQELITDQDNGNSLTAHSGKLQDIHTPCYTTKIPAEMHVTKADDSCTFLGATPGGKEQTEVKVIQVPGLSQANLPSAAKADAANVIGAIPGGSIGEQGSATFAGSQAYQIEIKSTDGSAGLISYVYDTTSQGNLVIVLHTQARANGDNYKLSLIESNWAWL